MVTGARPEACKCTARGASPKCMHVTGSQALGHLGWCLELTQMQWPGLAAGVVSGFRQGRGGGKKGRSLVTGICKHKYLWGKSWWTPQRSPVAVLVVLQWQNLLGLSVEQVTRNCEESYSMAAVGSPCFSNSFVFFHIGSRLALTNSFKNFSWIITSTYGTLR